MIARSWILLVLVGTFSHARIASAQLMTGLTFTGGTTFTNTNFILGYAFSPTANINVTSLGYWDFQGNGLASAHQVGLWNSSGTLLGSTTVPSGSSGTFVASGPSGSGFRFITLGTPITLTSGATYVVGGLCNGDSFLYSATGVTTGSQINYVENRYVFSGSLSYPNQSYSPNGVAYFGGNFQYTPVPEATSMVLFSVGGLSAMSAWWRRRRLVVLS